MQRAATAFSSFNIIREIDYGCSKIDCCRYVIKICYQQHSDFSKQLMHFKLDTTILNAVAASLQPQQEMTTKLVTSLFVACYDDFWNDVDSAASTSKQFWKHSQRLSLFTQY